MTKPAVPHFFSLLSIFFSELRQAKRTLYILIFVTAIVFLLGIWHGIKTKSGFYLSVIPFSLIIIVSVWLFNISHEEMMLLFISLFIIGSVTLTIKNLIYIQKKWANEQ